MTRLTRILTTRPKLLVGAASLGGRQTPTGVTGPVVVGRAEHKWPQGAIVIVRGKKRVV
jgi:hypothetical protein